MLIENLGLGPYAPRKELQTERRNRQKTRKQFKLPHDLEVGRF